MAQVDPESTKYLKQLKRQTLKRQKVPLEVLGMGTSSLTADVTLPPPSQRKRGRPGKMSHPRMDTESSSTPSILGGCLELAQGVQIRMTPEEEIILAGIPTENLVEGLTEMLSRSLVVTHTLGDELNRNSIIMVAKLKIELAKASSSLKSTLEAMGTLEEKCHQVSVEADEAKSEVLMLETELQVEKVG